MRKKGEPAHENAHKRKEVINQVCDLLLGGTGYTALVEKLGAELGYSEGQVIGVYQEARKYLVESTLTEIDQIIHTHTALYEQIYEYFDDINFIPGKLKAMKRKENLLGLHKEETTVEINNELNVEIEHEHEYVMAKLTIEERRQLEKYLAKIR